MPGGWIVKKRSCPSVIGDSRGKSGFSTARKTGVRISWRKAKNRGERIEKRKKSLRIAQKSDNLGKRGRYQAGYQVESEVESRRCIHAQRGVVTGQRVSREISEVVTVDRCTVRGGDQRVKKQKSRRKEIFGPQEIRNKCRNQTPRSKNKTENKVSTERRTQTSSKKV